MMAGTWLVRAILPMPARAILFGLSANPFQLANPGTRIRKSRFRTGIRALSYGFGAARHIPKAPLQYWVFPILQRAAKFLIWKIFGRMLRQQLAGSIMSPFVTTGQRAAIRQLSGEVCRITYRRRCPDIRASEMRTMVGDPLFQHLLASVPYCRLPPSPGCLGRNSSAPSPALVQCRARIVDLGLVVHRYLEHGRRGHDVGADARRSRSGLMTCHLFAAAKIAFQNPEPPSAVSALSRAGFTFFYCC